MITNITINNFNKYKLTACRIKIWLEKSTAVIWCLCVNQSLSNFEKHL